MNFHKKGSWGAPWPHLRAEEIDTHGLIALVEAMAWKRCHGEAGCRTCDDDGRLCQTSCVICQQLRKSAVA